MCRNLIETGQVNLNSYYNPYRVLLDIYEAKKDTSKTLDILMRIAALYPDDSSIKRRIEQAKGLQGYHDTTGSARR
jgi:hypothetical protein